MKKFILTFILLALSVSLYSQTDTLGIYAVYADGMSKIDRINSQSVKANGLASAFTMGLAKSKAKFVFNGETSEHQFTGKAKLRIYFGNVPPEQAAANYMFTLGYSAKDFAVGRFEVKKKKRMLTGVSASILGTSIGAEAAEDVNITTNKIREGVYELTVEGNPGEYCMMFTAVGVSGFTGVFDFTIK